MRAMAANRSATALYCSLPNYRQLGLGLFIRWSHVRTRGILGAKARDNALPLSSLCGCKNELSAANCYAAIFVQVRYVIDASPKDNWRNRHCVAPRVNAEDNILQGNALISRMYSWRLTRWRFAFPAAQHAPRHAAHDGPCALEGCDECCFANDMARERLYRLNIYDTYGNHCASSSIRSATNTPVPSVPEPAFVVTTTSNTS